MVNIRHPNFQKICLWTFLGSSGFIALGSTAFESPALPVTVHNKELFLVSSACWELALASEWPYCTHCLNSLQFGITQHHPIGDKLGYTIHLFCAHSPNQKVTLEEWFLCVVQCLAFQPVVAQRKEVVFTRILEAIVVYSLEQKFVASGFGPVPCGWTEIWGRSPVQGVCTRRGAFWVTVV